MKRPIHRRERRERGGKFKTKEFIFKMQDQKKAFLFLVLISFISLRSLRALR
jgi:hypothetical protein